MINQRAGNTGARSTSRRLVGAVAVTGVAALVLAGCTSDDKPVADPSRILQTVDTRLAADGSITSISDTAISVAGKDSSSATTDHDPAKAAGDLPLRITTQYSTSKKTGTDLADLDGYSGRIAIDLTIENLTVTSKNLTYDVAGTSRSTPALVGAPFSVAASTVLTGTAADRIVTDAADSGSSTDGVVSTNEDGDAVVQWGRLLAPPTSGASSTLHLVADVKDFTAPTFDVAAQPGLSTDLSSTGVVNAAFGSDSDSELALQRRTIDLISQVNEVLARAGGTITEVRSNLETTSKTLGVSTAERLKESSSSLAGTMRSLSGELGSLNGDLGTTVKATQSTVLQQLQQTTTSLDGLLGDTSATAPAPVLDGNGCAATPKTSTAGGSVYGNLLSVSSQLKGYADASEACKQQVSAQLAAAVGPKAPDATTCAATDARDSLTCTLYESSTAINGSLIGLVSTGQALAARLQPETVDAAIASAADLDTQLTRISDALDEYENGGDGGTGGALRALSTSADQIGTRIDALATAVQTTHDRAEAARDLIDGAGFPLSMQRQNSAVADQLCALATLGQLDQADADRLRGYLTAEPCAGAPEGTVLQPGLGFTDPMDERLDDQTARWQEIVDSTSADATTEGSIGSAVAGLRTDLTALDDSIRAVRDAVRGGSDDVGSTIERLRAAVSDADRSQTVIATQLGTVRQTQIDLAAEVQKTFEDASDQSSETFKKAIDAQVRKVSTTASESNQAVRDAFDKSISGLQSTADEVTKDSKGTIDEQKSTLEQEGSELSSAVDRQTASSLERIAASTSASTRDVQGASTLLTGDLNRVMLDLGDRKVNGSGILGAMATSAAKSDSADYQLALASQNAAGYANVRAEDVAGILLQQEQFRASLDAATTLPAFQLEVPASATSTTLYTFRIGADR